MGGEAETHYPESPQEWLRAARRVSWLSAETRWFSTTENGPTQPTELKDIQAARDRRRAMGVSDDVITLAAVVHAGSLLDQRRALARLTQLAKQSAGRVSGVDVTLERVDPELERDVLTFLAARGGGRGRDAKTLLMEVEIHLATVEEALRAVVRGERTGAPVDALEPHARAQLMIHLRGASDFVIGYLLDHLAGELRSSDSRSAVAHLSALRAAADPRTLGPLTEALLESPYSEVRADAARAIARIDDARVAPVLHVALQTASEMGERLALIEALGLQGAARDSDFVREVLREYNRAPDQAAQLGSDPGMARHLIAALDAIFDSEQVETAVRHASHPLGEVRRAAIRAIGRAGDDTALAWLDRIEADGVPAGLHSELDMARRAVLARVELRGEASDVLLDQERRAAREKALERKFSRGLDVPPTKRHRALAWVLMVRARLASWFVQREAATEACERAHQADPGWFFPGWFQGRLWHQAGDLPRAVTGYRRCLPVAPRRLLSRSRWLTPIAQVFVTRAEQLIHQGHHTRARRLLDELWPYDLSRTASPVRLAVRRLRQQLAVLDESNQSLGPPSSSDPPQLESREESEP